MFCTYAHYTPQGRLFYIGKGTKRRAIQQSSRNQHWKNIVIKYGKPKVEILAKWDTEEEALSHERLLISCFRDMGYNLANKADGGKSNSGFKHTEEHKKRMSILTKGRPGKKPSLETLEKLRISHLGQKSWNKGLKGVTKFSKEVVEKRVAKLRGRLYNVIFKYIGTEILSGNVIEFVGNKSMKDAGFDPTKIRACANGSLYRKTHKGHTWSKKLLEKIL